MLKSFKKSKDCSSPQFVDLFCCDDQKLTNFIWVLQGAPWGGDALLHTYPSAPDPFVKRQNCLTLRLTIPRGAPREALLDDCFFNFLWGRCVYHLSPNCCITAAHFWTINSGRHNVKTMSQKLSWNYFWAPKFLQGMEWFPNCNFWWFGPLGELISGALNVIFTSQKLKTKHFRTSFGTDGMHCIKHGAFRSDICS